MQLKPETSKTEEMSAVPGANQIGEQPALDQLRFPEGFLWGVSTSHFQIEGNPEEMQGRLSDWAAWTQLEGKIFDQSTADQACDFFSRYEADIELCQHLNLGAFRLSLNWPALVRERGAAFTPSAVEFYKKLLKSLKARGFKTYVTLFHFCLPSWLAEIGGWNNDLAIEEFTKFTEMAVEEFGEYVDYWLTLNEPLAYAYQGYVEGAWPPGHKQDYLYAFKAIRNMLEGHARAYAVIHNRIPDAKVSFTFHWIPFVPRNRWSPFDHLCRYLRDAVFNHLWMNAVKVGKLEFPFPLNLRPPIKEISKPIPGLKGSMDFLGVNYYTRQVCEFEFKWPPDPFGVRSDLMELETSALGWEIYPQGMYDLLTQELNPYRLDEFGRPREIHITENGLASMFSAELTEGDWSLNDDIRCRYLVSHLKAVHRAITAGANVKAYLHWSLLDNFEWAEGLRARFGLVRVAYPTLERTLRHSAQMYADIAKNNALLKSDR